MVHNKADRVKYKNLLALGNFSFEGRSDYSTRLIVVTVGNGSDIISSHIPKEWTQQFVSRDCLEDSLEEEKEIVGKKRKASIRGPGNKDFRSARSAAVLSRSLTESAIETINDTIGQYSQTKNNEIIECFIQNIMKQFNINETKKVENAELNNKLVAPLKGYLDGLNT